MTSNLKYVNTDHLVGDYCKLYTISGCLNRMKNFWHAVSFTYKRIKYFKPCLYIGYFRENIFYDVYQSNLSNKVIRCIIVTRIILTVEPSGCF